MSFFKIILKIIAIVLIIFAIIYLIAALIAALVVGGLAGATVSGLGFLMLGATSFSAVTALWLAFGAAVLSAIADPKVVRQVAGKVGEGVSTVVTSLGSVATSGLNAAVKTVLSNPIVLAIGAYLGIKLLSKNSKKTDRDKVSERAVTSTGGMTR